MSPSQIMGSGLCIGCGICVVHDSPSAAAMAFDRHGQYKPSGPTTWLRQPSSLFAHACPFSPTAPDEDELAAALFPGAKHHHVAAGRFVAAYVGYVAEGDYRSSGSSGGMGSWMLSELLRAGLVQGVAHVAPSDPPQDGCFYQYRISRTEKEIRSGAKSRYYPIELSGVLEAIRATPGRYAVVGIPCFIKAVQLLRRQDPLLRERIVFTIGLFCGHLKSARFLESIAWQMKVSLPDVVHADFRVKEPGRPASSYAAELQLRDGRVVRCDWWRLADGDWGAGFFQNSACNFCDDVVAETADISLGDAWVEPYASDWEGTNVVIIRSPVLHDLVSDAFRAGRLQLERADGAFVERTQAGGLRQRREGLAYRLTWRRAGITPRKRVIANSDAPSMQRKLIYRIRSAISAWSHWVFWLAHRVQVPDIYVLWARGATKLYRLPNNLHRWLRKKDRTEV